MSTLESYLLKHQFYSQPLLKNPNNDLNLIVVIPCYNEPDLISTLTSLWRCEKPLCSVQVIVIINSSISDSYNILGQNEETYNTAKDWIQKHEDNKLRFQVFNFPNLPNKHAGVGLARKIGMDEAVRVFNKINNENGIIACLDADCTCAQNYFTAITRHFSNLQINACCIYFEHPINNAKEEINNAIIDYELFLRYYVQALRYAGYPYAYHTIGSTMVIRVLTYAQQGGMNKRKAGEDFYFLQKIIPLGNFKMINNTKVIPSARASDRVPFGTGKAISKHIKTDSEPLMTYHFQIFKDLRQFISCIEKLYQDKHDKDIIRTQPTSIIEFLKQENFTKKLDELKNNSTSASAFIKRSYRWLNGFKVLKYIHYANIHCYSPVSIREVAYELLVEKDEAYKNLKLTPTELLMQYRKLDKMD